MTKFVFNPKTGMMDMKKNDQIYFGGSQGGGLRVDDHKHNVKFIIEKDGTITNLFGLYGSNVAIYDMMDARMIATRVMHKFGNNHIYGNYKMFLKGYKKNETFIKSFDEFVNESILGDMARRDLAGEIRREDGIYIGSQGNKRFILPSEINGTIMQFDGKKFYYLKELDVYIAVVADGDNDTYYIYDSDVKYGHANMKEWFQSNVELRENDFGWLKALIKVSDCDIYDLDDISIEFYCNNNDRHRFIFHTGEEYYAYGDYEDAEKDAIEYECDFLNDNEITEDDLKRLTDILGDDFINIEKIKDILRESYENEYNDFDDDDKIKGLLNYNVIEDTNKYFEMDDSGNIDYNKPTFDLDDYAGEYADGKLDELSDGDIITEYFELFGYDDVKYIIDTDVLAKDIVNNDGAANSLASYDGKERDVTIDGNEYYFYKTA